MNNDKNQNHCICVANLSPEELDALLQEISIRLGAVHQAAEPEHPDNVDPTDQNHPTSKMEGDGEEVFGPMPLQAYDLIDFGETKLLFIPLCGEKFTWKKETEKDSHGDV